MSHLSRLMRAVYALNDFAGRHLDSSSLRRLSGTKSKMKIREVSELAHLALLPVSWVALHTMVTFLLLQQLLNVVRRQDAWCVGMDAAERRAKLKETTDLVSAFSRLAALATIFTLYFSFWWGKGGFYLLLALPAPMICGFSLVGYFFRVRAALYHEFFEVLVLDDLSASRVYSRERMEAACKNVLSVFLVALNISVVAIPVVVVLRL